MSRDIVLTHAFEDSNRKRKLACFAFGSLDEMNPYSTTTLNTPLTKMAVCSDIFLFTFVLLDTGGLIFILIYFIITLSDLECDYLNAQECCAKLNFVSTYTYLIRIFNINENNKIKLLNFELFTTSNYYYYRAWISG